MQKIGMTLLALVAVLALGFYIWNNNRHQQAMQEQITELAKQQSGQPASNPATPEARFTPSVLTTRPDTELARLSQTREVLSQGWRLLESRKPDPARQAVRIFQDALLNIDPQNPQFYNGLGRALLVSNQPREAIIAWRQGLAFSTSLPANQLSEIHSGIGWGYWNLHDYARAMQAWEAALQINPQSIDAWSYFAWVKLAQGQFEKARDGFVILYAHDSNNKAWTAGLNMARARNANPEQIAQFVKLPPLAALLKPLPQDPALPIPPATLPATQPGTQPATTPAP